MKSREREVLKTETEYTCEVCGKTSTWDQDVRNCERQHKKDAEQAACTHPQPLYYSVYYDVDEGYVDSSTITAHCNKCQKSFEEFKIYELSGDDWETIWRALHAKKYGEPNARESTKVAV